MTDAERKLWRELRQRLSLDGTHFRRQVVIAGFVTDFCCHAARLLIEVDGNQHGTDAALAFDAKRTPAIETEGYRVLRFSNHDVLRQLEPVLDTILAAANPEPLHG